MRQALLVALAWFSQLDALLNLKHFAVSWVLFEKTLTERGVRIAGEGSRVPNDERL